jgi:hypothetical protein
MWAICAPGVASWISAVDTFPVRRPLALASSRSVDWGLPEMSTDRAPLFVFVPVDQPLAVDADSDA